MSYIVHPRSGCVRECAHDLPKPPLRGMDVQPVHCGPPAFYPAEVCVPPVWLPEKLGASALDFTRVGNVIQGSLFPPHEHGSRSPWPADVVKPSAVMALERRAQEAGCLVRVQYSRGHAMHASTARPLSVCHHIGVRLRRGDGAAAYAVYRRPVAGAASWTWANIRTPQRRLTLTELNAWITSSLHN